MKIKQYRFSNHERNIKHIGLNFLLNKPIPNDFIF